jgi:ubiquinone/menaquinone biosynthesis C-methylase UbiE
MRLNVSKIVSFYKSDIGHYALCSLNDKISQFLNKLNIKDKTVIASGGALFYKELIGKSCGSMALQLYDATHADLTSGQGHFVQTERDSWPYRAENIDGIVMIHDLEFAENPDVYLREAWRVLKGEGRLFIIVPNRAGRWARQDNTPFGQGHPFSLDQMQKLLSAAHFQIDTVDKALFFPPYQPKTYIARLYRSLIEKVAGFYCMNAGVFVIEASKHIYAPTRGLKEITTEGARKIMMAKGKIGASTRSSKIRQRP